MTAISKDIVIIGGGPGGYESALEGAKLGHKITLIEAHKVGGTCLHYGCIPTKTLQHSAKALMHINHVPGIKVERKSFDYQALLQNKQAVVERLTSGIEKQLKALGVNLIYGHARLGHDTVVVESEDKTQELKPDFIILATGSLPKELPIDGIHSEFVKTSKGLLEMTSLPESLVIIGAGVIGMELAFIYNAFGCRVTIIEYMDNILPQHDSAISKRLKSMAKKAGINILNKSKATSIEDNEDHALLHYCHRDDPSKEDIINADCILLAAGRKPNLTSLNFDQIGVKTDGYKVLVDETFKSNVNHIYAIGDLVDKGMLAHVASHQGKWLMHYLGGSTNPYDGLIPSAVFTCPEIASVGVTEDFLKSQDANYSVHKTMFGSLGKAHAINVTDGFIKILTNESGIVIGVHILGEDASNLIQEGVLAIQKRMTLEELQSVIHVHPTLSEIYI